MARKIVAAVAFITSAAAYLVLLVAGVALAAVEQSGARGLGLLLVVGGTLAFAAAMFLIFASPAQFLGKGRKAGATLAAVCAILPLAVLAGAAFSFAGFPLRSAMPALDWALFAIGVGLCLGALALAGLCWRRISARAPSNPERRLPINPAEPQSGLM